MVCHQVLPTTNLSTQPVQNIPAILLNHYHSRILGQLKYPLLDNKPINKVKKLINTPRLIRLVKLAK